MQIWIRLFLLLPVALLLPSKEMRGQLNVGDTVKAPQQSSTYQNNFFFSIGYNYCTQGFLDAGVRFYHWEDDEDLTYFAGTAAGCEFNLGKRERIFIPYLGYQGRFSGFGYGLRTEYALSKQDQSFGLTPELGLSFLEMTRITFGYRFILDENDPMELSGFRFSIILAYPDFIFKSSAQGRSSVQKQW